MKKIRLFALVISVCLFFLVLSVFAIAENELPPKPDLFSIAGYGVEGGSYVQYAAVGEAINKEFGIKVRQIPCATDISRLSMMNAGRVDFSAIGSGAFFATEGLEEFSEIDWGPQPLRLVYECQNIYASCMAVRGNSGIKTFADLKGKRVGYLLGNPGLTSFVAGCLAWAGLTWDDVERIDYNSTTAAYAGVLEGTCDATLQNSVASTAYKLEASPHGIYWIPMPPENKQGWERFNKVCPFYSSFLISIGAGLSEENPVWLASYSFPTLFVNPDYDKDKAYWLTKAAWESYDLYKDAFPSMIAWNLPKYGLKTRRLYPWHEGSIKYLKEVGLWTEKLQRNQEALVERHEALGELWDDAVDEATEKKMSNVEFVKFWLEKREEKFPTWYEPVE